DRACDGTERCGRDHRNAAAQIDHQLARLATLRRRHAHVENRSAARARALAASCSRLRGGLLVSSLLKSFAEAAAMSSTAAANAASLFFEGLLNPLSFLTNCR